MDFSYKKLISGDVSIFFKHHEGGNRIAIILVYIDDMAIFGSLADIKDMKEFIGSRYKFTDLREISHFLGLHMTRNRSKKTLFIDQTHYVQNILNHLDMTTCWPTYTPLTPGTKLVANWDKTSDSSLTTQYQKLIGSLMYAMLGT